MDYPRSAEELAACPEFGFGSLDYPVTNEDRARGYVEIEGRRHNLAVPCLSVRVPVMPDVVAHFVPRDMCVAYRDDDGVLWTAVQLRDGSWLRRRSNA